MSQVHTYAYTNGSLIAENFPVEDVSEYIKKNDTTVWVDYLKPTSDDMSLIAKELDLHELAVEDALHSHQRPKVDYYEDHLFLASHALRLDPETGTLDVSEIDTFIRGKCIVTVRSDDNVEINQIFNRWNISPENISVDTSYLLYCIIDEIIDGYLNVVAQFDEYYDRVSEELFSESNLDITHQKEWFNMRRSLVQFHRVIISVREAINVLLRREHKLIEDRMLPYFHDTQDHLFRVAESTDVLRELVATIVDTNLNLRDYRQNQIVKQVTSWAAIIAVPTLVTGYFGMNVPFSGSGEQYGVISASALMIGASLTLYWIFRRRDWI
jgi:magnesium transporter